MSTIEKLFEEFYGKIKLTPNQKEDAKTKYNGVCRELHDHYYPNKAYTGDTKLLIGSYGKHTSIRPARDIDVIFIMPPEKFSQYDDNTSNKQSQVLQDVKKILEGKYPNTPIKAFGKIVKLEFADTGHDVELVPSWENEDGTFTIPDSENGGRWHYQDYRKEIADIVASEASTGKTKFLIRSVKKWADNCTARIKTFEIERVALAFFASNEVGALTTAKLFVDFFQFFCNSISDEGLPSHLGTALNRAEKALDFESQGKLEEAADEWRKIFGIDFPKADKAVTEGASTEEGELARLERLTAQYPSHSEEHLTSTYGIPFEIDRSLSVSIDADVEQDGFRKSTLTSFIQKRFPLLKRKKLVFRVSHNVPSPYQIKWKIRNFGEEAMRAGALRGKIYDDLGSETRNESTLYHGEHYVECYIIKNNKCVALGRILVPIGKEY